uniref:Uncharacterized protein n=1 Tax=uncultured prokaryote TaxID=198431 RepID=A0A0H5PVK8_9ZZZZ|nr:hypothetical protein [uncultured prokaryote]
MISYTVTDLSSASGLVFVLPSAAAGGLSSQQLSTNGACALVGMGAGTRSRSDNGRLYHGPLTEVQVNTDGRTLVAGQQVLLQAAYTKFLNTLFSSSCVLAIISRKYERATAVSNIAVGSVIATQRRRIRG